MRSMAADQAVAHHAVDGPRDRRWLDGHHPAQLALGLAVAGVQEQQDRPLRQRHAVALQPP